MSDLNTNTKTMIGDDLNAPILIEETSENEPGTELVKPSEAKPETGVFLPEITEDIKEELRGQAKTFLQNISHLPSNSPQFEAYMNRIEKLGDKELSDIGGSSNRMLERNIATLSTNRRGMGSQEMVTTALTELNTLVKELAPNESNLNPRNLFGFKKRNGLNLYFERYAEAQSTINNVVSVLLEGKDIILRDNAMLEEEKQQILITLNALQENLALTSILEEEANEIIAQMRAEGRPEREVTTFESDVIFAVRQKKQDILTRMTVGSQSYVAMGLIRDNNKQLRKSIDNARATTVTALRTAVLVAQSVANQKNLMDNIETIVRDADISIRKASRSMSNDSYNMQTRKMDNETAIAELTVAFNRLENAVNQLEDLKEHADSSMMESTEELKAELEQSVTQIEETITSLEKED